MIDFTGLDILEGVRPEEGEALMKLARMVSHEGMKIGEVGSWKGYSTAHLATVAKEFGGMVYGVDHWKGSEGIWCQKAAADTDIYSMFTSNMERLGLSGCITPVVMDSIEAVKTFEDNSLDMVFIDADHRYSPFVQDVTSWMPKVRKGGIICGHDCEGYYMDYPEAAREKIDERKETDYIIELELHPGVIGGLHSLFLRDYWIYMGTTIWVRGKNA